MFPLVMTCLLLVVCGKRFYQYRQVSPGEHVLAWLCLLFAAGWSVFYVLPSILPH
jgi:hypothetical protein